ncbi:MAG TPA: phytanoyl-CoA dioxygenase family protein [Opitutaceae bacterium]|nr:phytanoyl-CoA dioxygenase family protein [Opitutaceae bacterium]
MSIIYFSDLRPLRERFDRDGYVILEKYFSPQKIDSVVATLSKLLGEGSRDVVVDNVTTGKRTFWAHAADRETGFFKFNDLYLLNDELREIALEPVLSSFMGELLGQPVVLSNSLNCFKSSMQPKHLDSLYMTPASPGALIAMWVALEDVHRDAGPLTYYPHSHKIPLFRFKDGTHHANATEMTIWNAYIEDEVRSRKLSEHTLIAKKGDVMIWHSDLLHTGGWVKNRILTRKSFACHYFGLSDCKAQKQQIVPLHRGFWMQRLRQPVRVPLEVFAIGERFPEKDYLQRYPDVRVAVETGKCPSGWMHYQTQGFDEGRGI